MAGEGGGAGGGLGGLVGGIVRALTHEDTPGAVENYERRRREIERQYQIVNAENAAWLARIGPQGGTLPNVTPSVSRRLGLPTADAPLGALPGTPGSPVDPTAAPWPTTGQGYADLAAQLALQLYQWWLQQQQAEAARRAWRRYQAALRRYLDALARRASQVPYPNTSPLLSLVAGPIPSMPTGDYWGSGPGVDLGDIYGPNSALCNMFGIGCGSGGEQSPFPGSQLPSIPGLPWQGGGLPPGAAPMPTAGGGCGSPFVQSMTGVRASLFAMANPWNGKLTWFRPAGRPVLFSGDLATCKRVQRIARRVRRRVGGR